jgi:hypothetical protein
VQHRGGALARCAACGSRRRAGRGLGAARGGGAPSSAPGARRGTGALLGKATTIRLGSRQLWARPDLSRTCCFALARCSSAAGVRPCLALSRLGQMAPNCPLCVHRPLVERPDAGYFSLRPRFFSQLSFFSCRLLSHSLVIVRTLFCPGAPSCPIALGLDPRGPRVAEDVARLINAVTLTAGGRTLPWFD